MGSEVCTRPFDKLRANGFGGGAFLPVIRILAPSVRFERSRETWSGMWAGFSTSLETNGGGAWPIGAFPSRMGAV